MPELNECKKTCWKIGAAAGVVVAAWLLIVSHIGFFAAIFLGFLTFGMFGAFLNWAFCDSAMAVEAAPAEGVKPVAASAVAGGAPAAAPVSPPAAAMNASAAVAEKPEVAPTPVAASTPIAASPEVATPAPVTAPAPVMAPVAEVAAVPAAASDEGDEAVKPKGLKAPRRGNADDLKLIEGIGPKLEERLNEWGIFHYDQIAAWGPAEVAYADNNVPLFKGRANRDKWVAQANLIVSEVIDVFLERAKTNDY
jgi:NADH-quinone oxidoreductase subunit E